MGTAAVALGIYALVDTSDMAALTKIDSDGKLAEFNGVGLLQVRTHTISIMIKSLDYCFKSETERGPERPRRISTQGS